MRFAALLDTECCLLICSLGWILVRVLLRKMLTLSGRRVNRGFEAGTLRFVALRAPRAKAHPRENEPLFRWTKVQLPLLQQGAPTKLRVKRFRWLLDA